MKKEIGVQIKSNEGYTMEVVEILQSPKVKIKFVETGNYKIVSWYQMKAGSVKNPNHPSVYGFGYLGEGDNKRYLTSNKPSIQYTFWRNMLYRAYSEEYSAKEPTYLNVSVCEEWLNFQNFANWFNENYIETFNLDKDLLSSEDKIYSPRTCCFLPSEINMLLANKREMSDESFKIYLDKYMKKYELLLPEHIKTKLKQI